MKKYIIFLMTALLLVQCKSTSKTKKEESVNYGIITATDVNVRSRPTIKSKVLFQLDKGDTVEILDKIEADTSYKFEKLDDEFLFRYREAILTKKWKLYIPQLDSTITFQKGKAIKVGSPWLREWDKNPPEEMEERTVEVEFGGKKYRVTDHIEVLLPPPVKFIETPWYKIKTDEGKIGYVYGEFLKQK